MRMTRAFIGLALAVTLASGCKFLMRTPDNKDIKPPPVLSAKATPESLVNYLNENARLVNSVRAKLDMDVTQKGKAVGPTGVLACQKPRDFRLRANVLGSQEVDIGSNTDELFFWIKRAVPPHQYIASHKDLAAGKARMPFPFQPEMVLVALGMADYDPAAKYDLKVHDTTLDLVTDAVSAEGRPIKRTVVFLRKPASGGESQIIGHVVKDTSGKLICQARILKVYRDRSGALVPSDVKIEYPSEEATIRLMLTDIQVNSITKEDSSRLFARTPVPGAEVFDLAKAGTSGVSRAGYFPR